MKFIIAIALFAISSSVFAGCPSSLLGRWEQTHFKMKQGDKWEEYTGPFWDYQKDGTVKVMMGMVHKYACQGKVIKVATPIETTFEILKQSGNKMEVKVNNGEYGFFTLEKK